MAVALPTFGRPNTHQITGTLLTPIITLLLTTAVEWSGKAVEIARNLVLIPAWLGGAVLVVAAIAFLRRFIFGR